MLFSWFIDIMKWRVWSRKLLFYIIYMRSGCTHFCVKVKCLHCLVGNEVRTYTD
jgi:hypothetical protein